MLQSKTNKNETPSSKSKENSLTPRDSGFSSGFLSSLTETSDVLASCTSQMRIQKTPEKLRDAKVGHMNATPPIKFSPYRQKTPKKRKVEFSQNENFYSSLNFVSPVKQRAQETKEDKNRARRILKEKSSSENVIPFVSTPKQEKKGKFGKFRSFHQPAADNKFGSVDIESIEEEPAASNKNFSYEPELKKLEEINESSINFSNLDFSNLSSTNFLESHSAGTSTDIGALCTAPINLPRPEEKLPTVAQKLPQETTRKYFYCDISQTDILKHLFTSHLDNVLDKILHKLNDSDLVNLCMVSSIHKNIIESNESTKKRRLKYLENARNTKENKEPAAATDKSDYSTCLPEPHKSSKKRKAFAQFNERSSQFNQSYSRPYFLRSPSVSPGKRKFQENQKVRILIF